MEVTCSRLNAQLRGRLEVDSIKVAFPSLLMISAFQLSHTTTTIIK